MELNDSQRVAVAHRDGPMLVPAGPGSGKTTVIAGRAATLINTHGVDPASILVITFTRSAANSIRARFRDMFDGRTAVTFGTFHSVFFNMLRVSGRYRLENVLQGTEARRVISRITSGLGLDSSSSSSSGSGDPSGDILDEIACVNNELADIAHYDSMILPAEDFRAVYAAYAEWKRENGRLDFDDMLRECHGMLEGSHGLLEHWRGRFRYILIDEFQDINRVQLECVKLLAAPGNNIFAVGDDDQSIYRFRGARPEYMLDFSKTFPGCRVVPLEINYRSTDEIIRLSQRVIAVAPGRFAKGTRGTGQTGKNPVMLRSADPDGEAIFIANKILEGKADTPLTEMAVIYRTNIQARAFIDAFYAAGIPFAVKDMMPNIFEHWVCRDICVYIRLALDINDNAALERILNKPSRYISNAYLAEAKRGMGRGGLFDSLRDPRRADKRTIRRMEELLFYLNAIRARAPREAIAYIRQAAGYDDYIKSYSEYRRFPPKQFYAMAGELAEAAGSCGTLEEFLRYVETGAENIRQANKAAPAAGVTMTTMHSAKGLEYDTVFVAGAVEGLVPYEKSRAPAELAEERRLFYVALTRPRRMLYISVYDTRYGESVSPSRFLNFTGAGAARGADNKC